MGVHKGKKKSLGGGKRGKNTKRGMGGGTNQPRKKVRLEQVEKSSEEIWKGQRSQREGGQENAGLISSLKHGMKRTIGGRGI